MFDTECNPKRYRGVVSFFSENKGWGYITAQDEEGNTLGEVFVHFSNIQKDPGTPYLYQPREGDLVEFSVKKGRKSFEAKNVTLIERGKETDAPDATEHSFVKQVNQREKGGLQRG